MQTDTWADVKDYLFLVLNLNDRYVHADLRHVSFDN